MIYRKLSEVLSKKYELATSGKWTYGFLRNCFVRLSIGDFSHRISVLQPQIGALKPFLDDLQRKLLLSDVKFDNFWVTITFDEKIPSWRLEKMDKFLFHLAEHCQDSSGEHLCSHCHKTVSVDVFELSGIVFPMCSSCVPIVEQELIYEKSRSEILNPNLTNAIFSAVVVAIILGILVWIFANFIGVYALVSRANHVA